MPENYINKEFLDAWVAGTLAMVKRNISDIQDHDNDIEEIRAMLRKEVGKLYDRMANDCRVAQKELHELETRVEKDIADLKLDIKVELKGIQVKVAMWGMLGGLVVGGIVSAIIASVAG